MTGVPTSGEADLDKVCPNCFRQPLTLRWWMQAKPLGSYSLAGVQMKVSAFDAASISCPSCDWTVPGRLVNARMIDGKFIAGDFQQVAA